MCSAAVAIRKRREDYHSRRAILQAASKQLANRRSVVEGHQGATTGHQLDPRLQLAQSNSAFAQHQYQDLGKRLQYTRATLLEEAFTAYNVQAVDTDEQPTRESIDKESPLHRIGGLILPAIGDIKRQLPALASVSQMLTYRSTDRLSARPDFSCCFSHCASRSLDGSVFGCSLALHRQYGSEAQHTSRDTDYLAAEVVCPLSAIRFH